MWCMDSSGGVTMHSAVEQQSFRRKKMTKQLTGKKDDTPLHSAARYGNLALVNALISEANEEEMEEMLTRENQDGETALFVAAEYGYVDVVSEMIRYYDASSAGIKAKNGFDAFHMAAKQGDVGTSSFISYLIFKVERHMIILLCISCLLLIVKVL